MLLTLWCKVLGSKLRPPEAFSARRPHPEAQTDLPPRPSTESHGESATCNKASHRNRHCVPGLRLNACVSVLIGGAEV